MFNRIICKYSISPLLVTAVYLCIYCSEIQPAWSQQVRPRAVVLGLNTTSTPEVSEQILLEKLRKKLEYTFDLSSQSAFEKSLGENQSQMEIPNAYNSNAYLMFMPISLKHICLYLIYLRMKNVFHWQ